MNYDTAKRLKDAGWNRHTTFLWVLSNKGWKRHLQMELVGNEILPCPTLSELIEACGDSFVNLTKSDKDWHCNWFDDHEGENTIGGTPEEAVANLFLAINRKE